MGIIDDDASSLVRAVFAFGVSEKVGGGGPIHATLFTKPPRVAIVFSANNWTRKCSHEYSLSEIGGDINLLLHEQLLFCLAAMTQVSFPSSASTWGSSRETVDC